MVIFLLPLQELKFFDKKTEAIYSNRKENINGSIVDKLNLKEVIMALLETLAFVLGIIYGYVSPGKENRSTLLWKGLIGGILLAIILVGVGLFVGGTTITIMTLSGVAVFIEVLLLTILFIIGTWIGDWIEGRSRTKGRVTKVSTERHI